MPTKIKFGTDGWRGHVAEDYTFESVRRCSQGFASYLLEEGNAGKWVIVGYDKRFRSEDFADAVAEVLAGNGLKVYLTDDASPTPVISYSVVAKNAVGAVNVTASHNPPTDNGFKVRDENGGAINPEGLTKIEDLILEGGATKVIEIHNARNPSFPEMKRPEPIPPNVNIGLQATIDNNADIFLVNDGDADRVGFGDENGGFIDQLRAYGLLAYYLLEVRGERGAIVKTLSTTTMLNKLGKVYDVPVHETGVGFKYVAPKFTETDALIGGEESGGYAFRGNVPERDGILAGLYMLDLMVRTGKKPTELLADLFEKVGGEHFYNRIDTPFEGDKSEKIDRILAANPETLGGLKVTKLVTVDGFQFHLEDGGWLLIRFSGTEPIIRVYCETMHEDKVDAILQDGLKIAGI
ncbi:MAG: hypothetical protein B6243_07690 [Anaerolineaceae bacterium 4572_5.2]|nr:MAG: hypothetical protein B6243_07690 [Anaerolineaceae bacterium 4572_5.2]